MAHAISRISIRNYRSIKKLTLNVPKGCSLITICGSNNVGKTNFLRAVNLFFNEAGFKASDDIPYEIVEAIRGGGYKTTITIDFLDPATKEKVVITKVFTEKRGENQISRFGHRKRAPRQPKSDLSQADIERFLDSYSFIFLQASNINIPLLVAEITKSNILSGLDKLRKRQTKPLGTLKRFIQQSERALQSMEREITHDLSKFVEGIGPLDGTLSTDDWNVKFIFPKYELLREAIGTMVTLVLQDSNQKELDAKGSGVQRILFLTLMKYISEHSKKSVIWGIDEPEVFLQPGLQKKVFEVIKGLSQDINIFITTHSHHFVDLNDPDSVMLFVAKYKTQSYSRKKGKEYIKVSTEIDREKGYDKIQKIKEHLGITASDSWEILPYNVVVEGEDDVQYLSTLLKMNDLQTPKMLPAGGADKIPGFLAFLSLFCEEQEMKVKPKVLILLDFDQAGKSVFGKLQSKRYSFEYKVTYVHRADNLSNPGWEYEIEDFIYPEILLKGVNKILTKRKYKTIRIRSAIRKKHQIGFQKDGILSFITTEVKNLNPSKPELDFEETGLKLYLSKVTCDLFAKEKKLDALSTRYRSVEENLKEISEPF